MMAPETVVTISNNHGGNKAAEPERPLGWLQLNLQYFKTLPGILKLIELVFGIICMASASPALLSGTHFFLFVVVTSFISTLIWVFVYLLGIREALKLPINWKLTELLNSSITTILYAIAFIVQLSVWTHVYASYYRAANLAAGSFGLFATLAYGFGTYLLYLEHKADGAASS